MQTFNKFAEDDSTTTRYKPGSAYFRYWWKDIETSQGNYNFSIIDNHLAQARANNQTLDFRIMPVGGSTNKVPQWLDNLVPNVPGTPFIDMNNSTYRTAQNNLIQALGNRYDGHPDLGSVDIGAAGSWGEWHGNGFQQAMPTIQNQKLAIDEFYNAFPSTPLTISAAAYWQKDGSTSVAKYASDKGRSGWRGDSWGDTTDGVNWVANPHDDTFGPTAEESPNAWKNGPIAFEVPSGVIDGPIGRAVDDGIAWHGSLLNYGSIPIPQSYVPDLDRFVKKMGFRMVLRQAEFNNTLSLNQSNTFQMNWDNVGIAPDYRDHRIAFRLVDASGNVSAAVTTNQSIKGWLPGSKNVAVNYQIPTGAGLNEGQTYSLQMGLVFHNSIDRLVPISINGTRSDDWYQLSSNVTVSSGSQDPPTFASPVYLDLNSAGTPSTSDSWNILSSHLEGTSVTNLVSTDGSSTGISVEVTNKFQHQNSLGGNWGGTPVPWAVNGATTDSFHVNGYSGADPFASIRFSGLDPSLTYNFSAISSRNSSGTREGTFLLENTAPDNHAGTFDAYSDGFVDNKVLNWAGISPDSAGEVVLKFSAGSNQYAYLNAVAFEPVETTEIFLDLHNASTPSSGGSWNVLSGHSNGSVSNLVDTDGESTGIGVSVTNGFASTNSSGGDWGGDPVALAEAGATSDSFFVGDLWGDDTGALTFTGLDPAGTYNFSVISSRNFGSNRNGIFTLGGDSPDNHAGDFDANGDGFVSKELLTWTGVSPDSAGNLVLNTSGASSGQYAYLNAVSIEYAGSFNGFAGFSVIPEPNTLVLMGLCAIPFFARKQPR